MAFGTMGWFPLRTTLTAVGDVFLGDSPHLIGRGAGSCLGRVGWQVAAAGIRPLLGEADHHFVNLETVASHVGRNRLSLASVEMRGHPSGAEFCRACGWDVVNIANNHIFQHGRAAFNDTVTRLRSAGLAVVGEVASGKPICASLPSPIGELTFVGFSLRPEQYAVGQTLPYANFDDHETVMRRVDEVVSSAAGPVVLSVHWGQEFMREPSREQQQLARRLCGMGVRLIIGHHPHVVQGLEKVGDSLIAYSLGNFVFDLLDEASRKSTVLKVALGGDGSTEYELLPVLVGEDCLPERLSPELMEAMLADFEALSTTLLAERLTAAAELEVTAKAYYQEFSRRNYRHFFGNILRYNPLYSSQSVARGVLRRLGVVHDP
jgi:poly-gamma-glutamate synthesis protein (capsule biosynthesis protein)